MSWVKTDDGAPEHMKIRESGTAAYALWNAALGFCNRHLTDGRIDKRLLSDVWRPVDESFNHKRAAARLIERGLWHEHGDECCSELCPAHAALAARLDPFTDAYVVHDFFEYQRSKAEVLAEREATVNRVRKHRRKLAPESVTERVSNGRRNAVTGAVTNGVTGTVSNTHPDPDPDPDPDPMIERDLGAGLKIDELERLGFPRLGALAGASHVTLSRLMPVYRDELEQALRTEGKSWKYIAKVIESIRRERAKPAPPAGQPPPDRAAFFAELDRIEAEERAK